MNAATAATAAPLFIGSTVTYHGSMTDEHGRTFTLLPCYFAGPCDGCDDDEDEGAEPRYALAEPGHQPRIRHVRRSSVTPTDPAWRPAGAVEFTIAGYRYLVSHTQPGGGRHGRVVTFHTADGTTGRTWCTVTDPSAEHIRRLDAEGLRHPAMPL